MKTTNCKKIQSFITKIFSAKNEAFLIQAIIFGMQY